MSYLIGQGGTKLHLPKITGYIFAGVLFGPHLLKLLETHTVLQLKFIDDMALTFIALAAGGELRLKDLRARWRNILLTIVGLTGVVIVGVTFATFALRSLMPFLTDRSTAEILSIVALLGILSVARSPASAIAVISECRAKGPFTETVLGVTVAMDILVILLFAIAAAICGAVTLPGKAADVGLLLVLVANILLSVVMGLLVGWGLSVYIRRVGAELPILIIVLAFLVTHFSHSLADYLEYAHDLSLHLEPLLICMTAGFAVQNFSPQGARFITAIERVALPVYAIFFAIVGAAIDLNVLRISWQIALLLVLVRAATVYAGAYLGGRVSGDPPLFNRLSGLSFITQAGVSLGLASEIMRRFPEFGPPLATLAIAAITLNQLIGPVTLKYALTRVGEAGAAEL